MGLWLAIKNRPAGFLIHRDYGKTNCPCCGVEFERVKSDQSYCGKLPCKRHRDRELAKARKARNNGAA